MKSERLRKIEAENAKLERETPFNFCDRWCERCIPEKQMRCKLYQDELEQKLACIAHGKDEHDPETTEQVMLRQFEDMEKAIQNSLDEQGLELDFEPGEDFKAEETADRRKPRKDDALVSAADEYLKRARQFLKANFYDKKLAEPELSADFDTVNWYHTLLTVKLQRALNGFDDLDADEDFALYDTVAQFAVCQKAIKESIQALRNIQPYYPEQKIIFVQFLALLSNVSHRIQKLEESI